MDKKIEKKEKKKEEDKTSDDNTAEGDKQPETPLLERADKVAERLEAAIKINEEQIKRQEELSARLRLGGETEGFVQTKKPAELTPEQYAEKVLKGEANPLKDDGFN